jgi:nucleoside-diphosphate-sugar epimerase
MSGLTSSSISEIHTVAIVGGTGFIGKHLVRALLQYGNVEIRVLSRTPKISENKGIRYFCGDLLNPESLSNFLQPNCTVINLAFLQNENLKAIQNLAEACISHSVKRIIHCSTAVVAGNIAVDLLNEDVECNPVSEYQQSKLLVERKLIELANNKFDVKILRPTAVFGRGGKNLMKLANDLSLKNSFLNYARSCIFGNRQMHLVSVENVVAALIFLQMTEQLNHQIFIISDDDSPLNNYQAIEKHFWLMNGVGKIFPRIGIHPAFLRFLLKFSRKLMNDPYVKFDDRKLRQQGFIKPVNFEEAISKYFKYLQHGGETSYESSND